MNSSKISSLQNTERLKNLPRLKQATETGQLNAVGDPGTGKKKNRHKGDVIEITNEI